MTRRAPGRRRGSARRGRSRGCTPWPRLKTWPGAAAAGWPAPRGSARPRPPTARTAPPGRGCPAAARSGPTRRAASSSGTRKSTPTTSAPASPISAEQLAGADAEVDPRHAELADRCQHRGRVRHARSARSRPRAARRPRSRTAARRSRRPRPAPAGTPAVMPASRSISACQSVRRRRTSGPWCARGCATARPRPGSDARVNGAPAKPISGVAPSSATSSRTASATNPTSPRLQRPQLVEVGGGTGSAGR